VIVYVQRDGAAKIIGVYGCLQPGYAEEPLQSDNAEVVAYFNPPATSQNDLEAAAIAALNGGGLPINLTKLLKAKFVSDLAFRLGKAPAALTGSDLTAERNRIAAIYKNL
jgi:hypothetical protein